MRKTFPDQFGYDACLEKNWFWIPTDWTLSLDAAELSVGRGSRVEPFAGFSTKTEYYQHFLCISEREVDGQEYLDQLIEEYVTGELSLSQFEYKLEDIIGLRDVTSEGAKVQTGSTSFIKTVF